MQKVKKKKWLSVLLAVVLVAALLPTTAFAADGVTSVGTAEDLITAIEAGGSIQLSDNITLETEGQSFRISGISVTLDLNGFTLTRNGESSNVLFYINNGGSLTINDTKGEGAITSSYPVRLMSNSKFVLNGGTITSPKGAAVDIYTGVSNVLVEMNGGSVKGAADNTFGIRGSSNVVVNINGGVISAAPDNRQVMYISGDNDNAIEINFTSGLITAEGSAVQAYSGAVINVSGDAGIHSDTGTAISTQSGYGKVELNVTGGSITTNGSTAYAIQAREESEVNIQGGTVSGGTAVKASDTANVQISGGSVTGTRNPIDVDDTPTVSVTGGEFNKDVAEYVADTTAVAEVTSADVKSYVIGDTIADKAAVASDGDTITVTNGDVTLTDVPDGVTVTNSGDGSVTVNGDSVAKDETITTHTHTFGEPVWTWAEDGSSATATFTCTACDEEPAATEILTDNEPASEVTGAPSCGDWGETTYTATVTLNGQPYTSTKVINDIEPTGEHDFIDGVCGVCGEPDPDYEAPKAPVITAGADGTWNIGGENGLSFTSDAEFADFIAVYVDDEKLSEDDYDVKEGSTIVTLKPAYLETLAVGRHTLEIESTTGTATTNFTITKVADTGDTTDDTTKPGDSDEPKTGDNANFFLWVSLIVVSMVGACATVIYTKQGKHSKK